MACVCGGGGGGGGGGRWGGGGGGGGSEELAGVGGRGKGGCWERGGVEWRCGRELGRADVGVGAHARYRPHPHLEHTSTHTHTHTHTHTAPTHPPAHHRSARKPRRAVQPRRSTSSPLHHHPTPPAHHRSVRRPRRAAQPRRGIVRRTSEGGWGMGDRVLGWRQGLCVGLRVIGGCAWRQGRVLRGGGRLGVGSRWSVGSVCARVCHA